MAEVSKSMPRREGCARFQSGSPPLSLSSSLHFDRFASHGFDESRNRGRGHLWYRSYAIQTKLKNELPRAPEKLAIVLELWLVEEYDILALALDGRMKVRKFRFSCSSNEMF
ncbi:hypothetical protein J5N97_017243 [Dioscorea zingiberensis]|uniref:Uncharacterized protein n=1 Tax=Dioscorea zingiberensis TaxID=325984 RepID=A0A9D5CMW1_9LILI|nr:hypothetical protein J5N97_017243 [Dioscorea zingiberensis]